MSITPIASTQLSSAHSLQAYIELVYIRSGNEIMTEKMLELENNMTTTQTVMDSLTRIQELKNLIEPVPKGTFPLQLSVGVPIVVGTSVFIPGDITQDQYVSAASAFFGTPVQVTASFSSLNSTGTGTIVDFLAKLNTVRSAIALQIAQLSAFTPRLPDGSEDSNSLLAKLRIVYAETNGITNQSTALNWILDKYNDTGTSTVTDAGDIQQHITEAITAGQSLNATQTEDLRSFMYLFEEYYKSASAILQAISQIIQKMADAIAR